MIPELGHFALILAFFVVTAQGILPLVGAQTGRQSWMAMARPSALVAFLLVLVSYICLTWAFYVSDFSVEYVATHSHVDLPLLYRLSAVWGGHEGSLLLWMLMLTGWSLAVAIFSRQLPEPMVARVLGVLGLVTAGMLTFVLLTSNPFERLIPAPLEGRSLNPLLQDIGLIFHPPLLYMGYVGMSVAFAFAVSALIAGQLDAAWARWSRPWATVAWVFLTLGNGVGSWWAYYELGWGGWWFWDPVENASLMPWLVATALIHSLAVTEKRGSFKNWTVLLAIAAFALTLLGAFIVRSGVLTSVHAFAVDPQRGLFLLILFSITVGISLTLFAIRAPKVGLGGRFGLVSRETLLLVNNVLLVVACGAVLLGTLYPLIVDAFGGGKISVGPPYFNAVFIPIMLPLILLVAAGPIARWKHDELGNILRQLWPAAAVGIPAGIAIPFLAGKWDTWAAIALGFAVWMTVAIVLQSAKRFKTGNPTLSWWGMQIAHFGLAVFVIGATMISAYQDDRDVRIEPGQVVSIGGYTLKYLGTREERGPNYTADIGRFELSEDGQILRILKPEIRHYDSQGAGDMPMTEASTHSTFTRDLYVSLGEPLSADKENGPWAVRVYHKPFVGWIWAGCLLMSLGGFLAAGDRRYRIKAKVAAHAGRLDARADT